MIGGDVRLDGGAAPHLLLTVPELQVDPIPVEEVAPAPCTRACPAGVNVKAYVSLIAEGRFAEALAEVRRRCTLPSVCGRICHAPCEPACRRSAFDGPLAIRALKRFVTDVGDGGEVAPAPITRDQAVAVIGSGPAGLTAAHDLRLGGYPVTIFEAKPELGGMLRYGIADYRLPPDVLDDEIAAVLGAGIDVETGHAISSYEDVTALMEGGYDAVLVAVGAQRGRLLAIPGEDDTAAVEDALGFLRRVNEGDRAPIDGKVIVIGGGSTAIEAARTALRLGAGPVEILYRRSRDEMPAGHEEVAQAEAEGVTFRFLAAPQRAVIQDGRLSGIECIEMELGAPDDDGRRRPVPIPDSTFFTEAGRVLAAVGQEAVLDFVPDDDAAMVDRGLLVADGATSMTRWWGVFAAGDVVSGPATVIEAIAAGHDVAASIAAYLETGTPQRPRSLPPPAVEYGLADPPPVEAPPLRPRILGLEPGAEFIEVEQAYTADDAVAEARRCLRCGPCSECAACAVTCDRRHLLVGLAPDGATRPRRWLPLRTTMAVAARLRTNGSAAAGVAAAPDAIDAAVEVRPVVVDYVEERCRGCALCLDVCQFGALELRDPDDPESRVVLDPAACRGCALCAAVCPTAALKPAAHADAWWDAVLGGIFEPGGDDGEGAAVVVTCDTHPPAGRDADGDVVACRCVGQVHPGMLLELARRGATRITVETCADCRFENGARLAQQHVDETRALLAALGGDAASVTLVHAPRPEAHAADAAASDVLATSLQGGGG